MSLQTVKHFAKTFGFRMTVSFSAAFVLISAVLFGVAYYLVSSTLQVNDRAAVELKLKEYTDEYRLGSVASIKQEIGVESNSGTLRNFMVRLADAKNHTIALKPPAEARYDFRQLEQTAIDGSRGWIRLKAVGEDDVLDIASSRLPDGNLLQVGKGPEDREAILAEFENTFIEVFVAVILPSLLGGILLSRQALRPVRNLTSVLGPIIDTGSVKARVPVPATGDEFEELALRFNQALQRIETLVDGMRASMDNIAHDLRTPMTRLRGVAEMALQSDSDVEFYREALSDCMEESEQALRLLDMLMDISEVETGSVRLDVGEVDVCALMNKVCDLYRGVAEEKNITLRLECPNGFWISGDRNRLLQAMANLLDNAIKYTPQNGSVDIAVSLRDADVVIDIRDSGIGIPPEDLGKIWDRFFRGDKSRTKRGLGLGLSLAKAVILAHKGAIKVFSDQGKGTHVSVQFPSHYASVESLVSQANLSKL
ncbi:MAG TPA: HAMP domain-containing sensor histidine kinase [Candidatus Acidoferrum sp.]|nr:HAMP domain-containing sensor histidine kinase [Candidatus Acidoferrum sp.]